jgi:hypothetical protein
MPLQDYQHFRLKRAQSTGTSDVPETMAMRNDNSNEKQDDSRQFSGTVETPAFNTLTGSGASPTRSPPDLLTPAISAAETIKPGRLASEDSGGGKRGRIRKVLLASFDYDREQVC